MYWPEAEGPLTLSGPYSSLQENYVVVFMINFIIGRRPRHTILIGYEISRTHRLQSICMAFVTNLIGGPYIS